MKQRKIAGSIILSILAICIMICLVCTGKAEAKETRTIQFVIGQKEYIVTENGKTTKYTMDIAPYVKSGRTYIPIRYAGHGIGLTDDQITFDEKDKKAVLENSEHRLEVYLNMPELLLLKDDWTSFGQGSIRVDALPEVVQVSNGSRIMLPIRSVAECFYYDVEWSPATKSVILKKRIEIKPSEISADGKIDSWEEEVIKDSFRYPHFSISKDEVFQNIEEMNWSREFYENIKNIAWDYTNPRSGVGYYAEVDNLRGKKSLIFNENLIYSFTLSPKPDNKDMPLSGEALFLADNDDLIYSVIFEYNGEKADMGNTIIYPSHTRIKLTYSAD